MRSRWKFLCAGLLSLALAGCSDNNGTTSPPTSGNGSIGTTTNVVVTVSPSAAQVVDAGQTVALTATITGDSTNKGIVWTLPAGAGTLSSTTSLTTTYTAPATPVSGVVITATSVFDATKSASATVTVHASPSFTGSGQLPQGFVGVAYSTSVAATGGTGTLTFALASGSTLPAGLSLNPTTGAITGKPTAAGSSTFSITVTDSAATPQTATAAFTVGVSGLQANTPTVVDDVVGQAYPTTTFTSAYGQGTVTYAVSSGSLPAGLTLTSAGVLSGTPTAPGSSTFTVTATDSIGQTASTAALTINVAPVLTFSGGTLPTTVANTMFAGYTVAASGGTPRYTYTLAGGSSLPPGLTLAAGSGSITGTPTAPGSYSFSIVATDSGKSGTTLQSVTAAFTMTVSVAPLTFVTTTLPNGVYGSPYQQQVNVTGGIGPYFYTVSAGALPNGLNLTRAGILTGRPSLNGTYNFTVQATDSESTPQTVTQTYTVTMSQNLPPGPNNALLKGSYAFLFTGQSNGALASGAASSGSVFGSYSVGSLTFDGTSLITGEIDLNSAIAGSNSTQNVTGSYNVGTDNRGQIVLDYGSQVITLDIAVSKIVNGVANHFRFIEFDSDSPSNATLVQGSGSAQLQSSSAFHIASLTGRYVFRLNGETPSAAALSQMASADSTAPTEFGALAGAGYIQLDGSGLVVRGVEDATSFGQAWDQVSLTGTYTAPDASGRGTMTITSVGKLYAGAPTHFVYYVIDATQIAMMSTDAHSSSSMLAGLAHQQQQALYSAANLVGRSIAYENDVFGGNGTTTFPTKPIANFDLFNFDGTGTVSANSSTNTNGVSTTNSQAFNYVYSVSDQGRVVIGGGNGVGGPVFWLYDQNTGVGTELLPAGTNDPIGTLILSAQTGPYSNNTINGTYAIGTLASVVDTSFVNGNLLAETTDTNVVLTLDTSFGGYLTPDVVSTLTKGVDSTTGRFTINVGNTLYNGYIVSPTQLVYYNSTAGAPASVFIAEQ